MNDIVFDLLCLQDMGADITLSGPVIEAVHRAFPRWFFPKHCRTSEAILCSIKEGGAMTARVEWSLHHYEWAPDCMWVSRHNDRGEEPFLWVGAHNMQSDSTEHVHHFSGVSLVKLIRHTYNI